MILVYMSSNNYYKKYLEYKNKYLDIKLQKGGDKINLDSIFAEDISKDYKDKWLKVWEEEYYTNDNKIKVHNPTVLLKDLKHRIPYTDAVIHTNNLHDGQRKLFLSEIQFLTKCLDSHTQNQVVVYAGAAPSIKAFFAIQYFPNTVWILVDPNPFKIITEAKNYKKFNQHELIKVISSNKVTTDLTDHLDKYNRGDIQKKSRIYIINELFTNDLADKLSAIKDTLFVCDIRTTILKKGPSDCDILWNLSQQWIWMTKLMPKFSYLKFRHPFYSMSKEDLTRCLSPDMKKHFDLAKSLTSIDFIKNYKDKKLEYVIGDTLVQIYAPITSTESRILVKQEDINKTQDYGKLKDFEDTYAYFNNVKRSYLIHENKYLDKKIGFDQCQDCSATTMLWNNYLKKYNLDKKSDPLKEVYKYQTFFGRPLLKNGHGRLFDKLTQDHVDTLTEDAVKVFKVIK